MLRGKRMEGLSPFLYKAIPRVVVIRKKENTSPSEQNKSHNANDTKSGLHPT